MSARSLFENGAPPGFTFKTPIPASDDGYALTYNSVDKVIETTNTPVAAATNGAEEFTFTGVSTTYGPTPSKYAITRLDDGKFVVTLVVDEPNAVSPTVDPGLVLTATIPVDIPKPRVSVSGQVVGMTVVASQVAALPDPPLEQLARVVSSPSGDELKIVFDTALATNKQSYFKTFTATWISE